MAEIARQRIITLIAALFVVLAAGTTALIGNLDSGVCEDTPALNGKPAGDPIGLGSSPADKVELGRSANAHDQTCVVMHCAACELRPRYESCTLG